MTYALTEIVKYESGFFRQFVNHNLTVGAGIPRPDIL